MMRKNMGRNISAQGKKTCKQKLVGSASAKGMLLLEAKKKYYFIYSTEHSNRTAESNDTTISKEISKL